VGLLKAIKNLLLKPYRPVTVYNATGSAAINLATVETGRFRLVCVTIKFSAAPTTSEFITATLDAIDGAAYDCVLFKVNPSVGALTDILYEPSGAALIFEAGDNIALNFANTDTRTYGVRIVVEPC
jgi:hypothetical protein